MAGALAGLGEVIINLHTNNENCKEDRHTVYSSTTGKKERASTVLFSQQKMPFPYMITVNGGHVHHLYLTVVILQTVKRGG